jgi:hypothetical protein
MKHLLEDPNLRVRLIAAGTLLTSEPENEQAGRVVREGLADALPPVRKSALDLIESLGAAGAVFDDDLRQRQSVEDDPRVLEVLERLLARSSEVNREQAVS